MKKLLFVALVATGLLFVPVQRSNAQISVGVGGVGVGVGVGYPAYRYGYGYGYYPYGYYQPYYGYSYYRPYYWSNGHRYYRHHRHHYYHQYEVGVGHKNPLSWLGLFASQLFFLSTESAFDIAADARGRLGSDQLPNAPFTARSFFCALFTPF